ncbi:MAG: subtilisin family serine protease [Verrucomicrobiales bacterium]|jgi:subtilisin family serine protease
MSASRWITPAQAAKSLVTGDGSGVKIAILDSGIEASHPALSEANIIEQLLVEDGEIGPEVVPDEQGDVFGHGTAIAHIIHEIAPAAQIGSFKVLQARDGQVAGKAALLGAAVDAAIDNGYQIINCSFGTPARSVIFKYFKNWIDEAYLNDVHVVTACNNANYARPEWPAYFPSVIAVNMGRIETDDFHYRPGRLVEFFARGEKVYVPWLDGGWKTVTGSSYAAPRLSGLVARLLSKHPGLSTPLVNAVLREIAEPWNSAIAGDNVWT